MLLTEVTGVRREVSRKGGPLTGLIVRPTINIARDLRHGRPQVYFNGKQHKFLGGRSEYVKSLKNIIKIVTISKQEKYLKSNSPPWSNCSN